MESNRDKSARLSLMANGDPQWDLSGNDVNAIDWALSEIRALRKRCYKLAENYEGMPLDSSVPSYEIAAILRNLAVFIEIE
jgi:hypothetical protein